jgi:hypothetical protein
MLVQVEFLKQYSDTDSLWCKEVYDVPTEWAAIDNVYSRHTRFRIKKFKTKVIDGGDSKASSTNVVTESQGPMFIDGLDA